MNGAHYSEVVWQIIVFFFAQKAFVQGVTLTGVKG
jgi:ABC-type glycerol-3-phosphate transport system permease component